MSTNATLPVAFTKAAIKFSVAESDFLLCNARKITTFEALGYRFPKAEDFEEFLKEVVAKKSSFREVSGRLLVFDREEKVDWKTFKMSEDAAALRKLWSLSKEVCRKEMESLAAGSEGAPRTRVGIQNSLEMERKALELGMPQPMSDAERPALWAQRALVPPGATYDYLAWECFIPIDEEDRLTRQGKMPKAANELVIGEDTKLQLKSGEEPDPQVTEADNLET